jgi:hypothetical protein
MSAAPHLCGQLLLFCAQPQAEQKQAACKNNRIYNGFAHYRLNAQIGTKKTASRIFHHLNLNLGERRFDVMAHPGRTSGRPAPPHCTSNGSPNKKYPAR